MFVYSKSTSVFLPCVKLHIPNHVLYIRWQPRPIFCLSTNASILPPVDIAHRAYTPASLTNYQSGPPHCYLYTSQIAETLHNHDPKKTVHITPISPIRLTEVVLGLSEPYYSQHHSKCAAIAMSLAKKFPILVQGQSYTFDLCTDNDARSDSQLPPLSRVQCLATQPVAQGLMYLSTTRVIVVKWSDTISEQISGISPSESFGPMSQWDVENFILNDSIENNQDFLIENIYSLLADDIIAGDPNAIDANRNALLKRNNIFVPSCLSRPISTADFFPSPGPDEDDDNRAIVSLDGMIRLGLTSGTWVSISRVSKETTEKDVRSHAAQLYVYEGNETQLNSNTVCMAPMMIASLGLANLYVNHCVLASHESESLTDSSHVQIAPLSKHYIPSLFYSRPEDVEYRDLPVPIARKVIFSRVSSPLSERRDLDAAILTSLQLWMIRTLEPTLNNRVYSDPFYESGPKGTKKMPIINEGDKIAFPIAPRKIEIKLSALDIAAKTSESLPFEILQTKALGSLDSDINQIDSIPTEVKAEGNVIFFKAIIVEPYNDSPFYEEDNYISDSSIDQKVLEGTDVQAIAEASFNPTSLLAGRNGCLICPSVTQVRLEGAVHSTVPYQAARTYYDLPFGTPSLSNFDRPYNSAHIRCNQLLSISLHPMAQERHLSCTLLLKGPQGSGKNHIVQTVASELGMHIYELNCYKIAEDTPEQTADALRLYIKNCERYTPVILLLRSLDGLFLSSQSTSAGLKEGSAIARAIEECLADLFQVQQSTRFPLALIATVSDPDQVPPLFWYTAAIRSRFGCTLVYTICSHTHPFVI